MQKYPRGRRGSPAKGVGVYKAREGSNPSFCASLSPAQAGDKLYPILSGGLPKWSQRGGLENRCSIQRHYARKAAQTLGFYNAKGSRFPAFLRAILIHFYIAVFSRSGVNIPGGLPKWSQRGGLENRCSIRHHYARKAPKTQGFFHANGSRFPAFLRAILRQFYIAVFSRSGVNIPGGLPKWSQRGGLENR